MRSRPYTRAMPRARLLLSFAVVLVLCACAGGRGTPRFGERDLPPTRTIAGERLPMERYAGAWVDVAEAATGDQATLDGIWSQLESAGIPASAVAIGGRERVRVPGPHGRAARRLLSAAQRGADTSRPPHRYTVLR